MVSLFLREAQVELAGTVIKALGVNGSACGPGALSLLSASYLTLETELWEREAPTRPHSSPNSWKYPTIRC